MECRTFQRNLEDYLEGGLDFSGRFGMERHAQQCISCGKEMAGALRLSQMAREVNRVTAPPNFEAALLNRIGAWKSHARFSFVRRFWVFGPSWGSLRKLVLATSSLAFLALGILYLIQWATQDQPSTSPWVNGEHAPILNQGDPGAPGPAASKPPAVVEVSKDAAALRQSSPRMLADSFSGDGWTAEPADSEFEEYLVPGPGDGPLIVRLPKKIRMRYGQPSEEYFIQNVSH